MSDIEIDSNGTIIGQGTKRKLYFFWLLDESYSMGGIKIEKLNWAVKQVIPALEDIEKTERVEIIMRAITFHSSADWHVGPEKVPLKNFLSKWKDLTVKGSTATDEAIELLATELEVEKIGSRNVPPVCILISDGYCTSDSIKYDKAIEKLNNIPWGKKAVRLSIGIADNGGTYNKEELDKFISPYLKQEGAIETLHADTPAKLVNYITVASVQASISSSHSQTTASDSKQPVNMTSEDLKQESPVINDIGGASEVF